MEKLLRPEELAEMLNIKVSTIYNWTMAGKRGHNKIPFTKVGACLRFRQSEIEKWLQEPKAERQPRPKIERPKTGRKEKKNQYIDSLIEQAKSEVLQ
jgi:excisionase family DNA binding protein